MRASRLPVLILVIAAIAVAVAAVRADDSADDPTGPADDVRTLAPTAAASDALGSTWYCAAGSAGDITVSSDEASDDADDESAEDADEAADDPADDDAESEGEQEAAEPTGPVLAEHSVTIANIGDQDRTGTVWVHAGVAEPVPVAVEIAASSSETIELVDHAEGPAVAALVEIDGGDVVVGHQLVGEYGIDSGPCASTSSSEWHFAWGDTSRDVAQVIAVFNPFPGDAVVDFRFSTTDGIREPRALTGLVVPGHSVIVADVSAEAPRWPQVSTTVTARSGRVVAERLLVADGAQREDDQPTREGLAVDLGTPVASPMWVHSLAAYSSGASHQVVVYNPSDEPAEVDVEVALGEDVVGGVEPFQLSIRRRGAEVVRLDTEPRLADVFGEDSGRFGLTVRSVNGVPVVSELVVTLANPGWAASPQGNVAGTTTVFTAPGEAEPVSARLGLSSLDADGPTVVTVVALTDGDRDVLDEIELAPGERVEVELDDDDLDPDVGALVVESSSPVTAELATRWRDPDGYSLRTGIVAATGATPVIDLLG